MNTSRDSIIIKYIQDQNIREAVYSSKSTQFHPITIVVPAYNEESLVEDFIKNISELDYKNFNLILVDNNSTDKTYEIMLQCANRYQLNIEICKENNPGAGHARKCGMDLALMNYYKSTSMKTNGLHYIISTDIDTVLPNGWLEEINQYLEKGFIGILSGAHTAKPHIEKVVSQFLSMDEYFTSVANLKLDLQNSHHCYKPSGPNTIIEAEAYAACGGMKEPKEKVKETKDMYERLVRLGSYQIDSLDTLVYTNRRRYFTQLLEDSTDPYGLSNVHKNKRFRSIRDDEESLLQKALDNVDYKNWIKYHKAMTNAVKTSILTQR